MASRQIVLLTAFLVGVPVFRTMSTPTEMGRVDYTGAIDDERGQMRSATHPTEESPRFESFLTYTELKDALEGYAKDYDHVTYTTIGKSYEGRDLIAAHLATRYEDDEEIRHLVSTYEWRIHPVVNPDGYHYTHTVDRFWRKTLSKNNASSALCRGADANRNFDTREFCRTFHGQPSSSDPCSITYCGSGPFSEPETRAIRDAVMAIRKRTKFFFDMHSYGTMWMFPYGYTGTRVPEYDQLLKISRKASAAIERVQGSVYRVGSMYETAYPISGGSADWAYDTAGVKKSFSIELQPKSSIFGVDFGFLFPSKRILPTAKEAWEGIKAAVLF
ncbi:hypothetical protein HPB50_010780 [Hyalomma asiaticum]|uniref:Uncharacterized protein n=1 Tax=Hyalomma asiaticum TaxID=266040 RepID=A0ACB7T7B8_HYAAI|nr:hypothetical protein HPB50_010780 [Hyalomma asiaticum]